VPFDSVDPSFGVRRSVFAFPTRKTRAGLAAKFGHRHGNPWTQPHARQAVRASRCAAKADIDLVSGWAHCL
jgi:hypothetical protein